jgi:steroid 5-alpha reductase family enzyme
MRKHFWISALLSILVIVLLPVHAQAVTAFGNHGWVDIAFGLPIGLITAFNINLIATKIAVRK